MFDATWCLLVYKFTINKKNRRGKESVRDEPGTKDLSTARNPNELRGQSRMGRVNLVIKVVAIVDIYCVDNFCELRNINNLVKWQNLNCSHCALDKIVRWISYSVYLCLQKGCSCKYFWGIQKGTFCTLWSIDWENWLRFLSYLETCLPFMSIGLWKRR